VVSCQFGLDYPDRALALIVGHTVPYLWPLGASWLDDQIVSARRGEPAVVNQPRSYEWEESGPPTSNPARRGTPPAAFAATLNSGLGGTREAAVQALEVLAAWDMRPRYAELNRLTVPTLVIVGGHEPQKTLELAHEWHQQIAGSEFAVLPDAYHAAAREEPVAWNAAVHGFLKRHGL
jgi:pimeloyl-ACP methyl ester carboxylesterase